MDHFIDLKVLPDLEFSPIELMNALFSKVHRAIGLQGEGRIGISFPQHQKTLGEILRLHGSYSDLMRIAEKDWLKGLTSYVWQSPVTPIPAVLGYRTVRRVQHRSVHNKRKRSIAKGWLSPDEARLKIPEERQKKIELPYAEIRSLSNKNLMRVYVLHGPVSSEKHTGVFNAYGLSREATIPWF